MKKLFAILVALGALNATQVDASPLILSYSGVFGAATTVGGVALGMDTPFSFEAAFDSATDISSTNGEGLFDTVITFQIGAATYTTNPAGDVNVLLVDTGFSYLVGLADSVIGGGFLGEFTDVTSAFDADVPGPSTFFNFFDVEDGLPFTIPLAGGFGDLVINDLVSLGETAEITAAAAPVPEPTSLLLFGTGLVGAGVRRYRQRRRD